eukprot:CAMPEP_0114584522 /NCGR_PEP_ID=MMETSP0125-20121206/8210_1 /TAXON_ID=485358 ORGANISM="Aristerostoma sp., Strain ATCC 50986" /NCGR_SAMPLE_ID=MMETSP0125 /ASSEMBLY_ACC=CAM_ASM_000245 /LENGTH=145 /DNA_ID=CAMNT_0001778973 /DNA_START=2260 /DNA_END=2697 /DNA_ORIENTATION=+
MIKEVDKAYYDKWVKKYDYMGRWNQTDKIIYNQYYDILEGYFKKDFRTDMHIAGHKKEWASGVHLKRFYHLCNRGKKMYFRPTSPCVRLGLNVEKLFPGIDWRERLTRGVKGNEKEWAVGYMLFDVKKPDCYKNLPEKVLLFEKY